MIKEAICEGSDVQNALEKAKAQLGLDDTSDYEFEIIQTEEKKRFGLFGGRDSGKRADRRLCSQCGRVQYPEKHHRCRL